MKTRAFIAAACFVIAATAAQAQTFTDGEAEASAAEFELDVETNAAAYAGRYHFGFSEGESDLVLTVRKNAVVGELTYAEWDRKTNAWKSRKARFTGTITGNMLVGPNWKGIFVKLGGRRGLLIMAAPVVAGEFGYRYEE